VVTEIVLRRARLTDAREIARVHRLSRAHYYGVLPESNDDREAMWAHLLSQHDRLTWIAEASGAIVGFLSARHSGALPDAELELTAIYVLPEHYGRGVGSRLHDAFERERGSDVSGVLEVWAANSRAIEFYRRRGWIPTETVRPGPQDAEFVTYQLRSRPHAE
jgi:ribosomal protein S18 acetylase RimI-like enzyme